MGRAMGIQIWDPSVYYFPEIPSEVVPWKAALVLCGAVLFSVLGALLPAVKAAQMDPVRALRFE
jgi:lipoprotein-releasing system permease protein